MKHIVRAHFVKPYTTEFETSSRVIPCPAVHNALSPNTCATLLQKISPPKSRMQLCPSNQLIHLDQIDSTIYSFKSSGIHWALQLLNSLKAYSN